MSSLKVLSALVLLSPIASYALPTCTGIWVGGAPNDWGTGADWSMVGGSCVSTYPGEAGITDSVFFNNPPATPGVVTLNVTPSINLLTFNNNSANPAYTITPTASNALVFVGTTPVVTMTLGNQLINAPIQLNLAGPDPLEFNGISGTTLTLTGGVTDTSGTSTMQLVMTNAGTVVSTAAISVGAEFNVFGGTFTNTSNVTAGTSLTIQGSGVVVTSNNNTPCTNPIMTAPAVNLNGGSTTINCLAACPIATNTEIGTLIEGTATVVVSGDVFITNGAAVMAPGPAGATGSQLSAPNVSMSGGTITMSNTGTISVAAENIGAYLYNSDATGTVPMTFTNRPVLNATNSGAVTAGVGVKIISGLSPSVSSPITIDVANMSGTSGGVTMTNAFSLTGPLAGSGTWIEGSVLTINSGFLSINNTGATLTDLTTLPAAYGQFNEISLTGTGELSISNTGTLATGTTAGAGVSSLAGGSFTGLFSQVGTTSSFTNTNSGTVNAAGFGSIILVEGTTTLSGAAGTTFSNINSGPVTVATGAGAYVHSLGALTLGGTSVTLTNSGAVSPAATGAIGSWLQAATIGTSGSGSALSMSNSGTITLFADNIGTELLSSGAMTLSAGTWSAINTGSVSVGTGVQIEGGNTVVLDGTISITMTNNAVLSGTGGFGGQFIASNTLNFPSGTPSLTLQNNFPLSGSTSAGMQATVENSGAAATGSTLAAGTLSLANSGDVSGTAGAGVQYVVSTNDFIQSGGTLSLSNADTITSTLGGAAGAVLRTVAGTANIGLTGGSFSMSNTGAVSSTAASYGTAVIAVGGLTLASSGGTVTNSGSINGTGAIGSLCQGGALSVDTASILDYTNSGSVSANAGNVGVLLQASTGNITLGGAGTLQITNNGPVSLGTGIELQAVSGSMNLNAGTLNLNNSSSISGGVGSYLNLADNLTIQTSATALHVANSGSNTGGTGALIAVGGDFAMSTGEMIFTHAGNLSGTANGAAMVVTGGSFSQTGGVIDLVNAGTNTGTGNPVYIQSTPTIAISGGSFTNANALVAAPTVTVTGGRLQAGTATVPGTFDDATFGGTTTINLESAGTFVAGTLDPAPGQTLVNGTFTQTGGTYTVVVGNLNLPGNQGISFLTVDGTGVVNLTGGTLNVIPATGFNFATDVPAGLEMVQFIQAATIINGGFTPAQIINTVPGLIGMSYETIAGNEGWLLFNFMPPTPPTVPTAPPSTPINYPPITVITINIINNFIGGELIRMQDRFVTNGQANCSAGEENEYNKEGQKGKNRGRSRCNRRGRPRPTERSRKSAYTSSLANLSMTETPKAPTQTIANPVLAAAPQFGFVNRQTQVKQQQLSEEMAKEEFKPWNAYFGPLGDIGSINNKHSQLGANFWYVGGLAGFDYAFSQVGVGLLVDYENVKAKVHKHGGDFRINQFHATAYTTYVPESFPQFAVNGMVGAGGMWCKIHRNILDLPVKESTQAKSRGAEVDALVGAQYMFAHRQFCSIPVDLQIIPMFNLQYVYQGLGTYKEHGAGDLDLEFSKQGYQSLRSTLGTWIQYTWGGYEFSFTPLANIGWQREYLDRNHRVHTKPIHVAGPEGKVTIFGAGRDTLVAGLDLMFEFYDTYGLEASYTFEYNSLYRNNGFFLGLNISF